MKINYKKGQVLLITVMLLATIVTVTLAVTLKSTTETQVTKLEEESQKALAAAEAGVEAALQRNSNIAAGEFSTLNIPAGFSGSATIATTADSDFVTPLLQQDQQYTFYLANYPGFTSPYTGSLTVYYNTTTPNCNSSAIELTVIHDNSPYTIKKFVADTGGRLGGSQIGTTSTNTIENTTFYCSTSSFNVGSSFSNAKILIVRALYAQTKIGLLGNSSLKVQGSTVTSEARSATGVTKKVQLFQSYPQIPAEFFVTSF